MLNVTQRIYDELKTCQPNLKVFMNENENGSEVQLSFGLKNSGQYMIRLCNIKEQDDTAIRIFRIISVEKEQIPAILPVLNQINAKYRFVKFYCDSDGDVNLSYDFFSKDSHPDKCAMEAIIRIVDIMDEVYPILMQALWT